MLAALLNWPQGTFASKAVFDTESDGDSVNLTRETDAGLETIKINSSSSYYN